MDIPATADVVKDLLRRFFEAETALLAPAPGAADALAEAAGFARIVILSNLPAHCGDLRRQSLMRHGMDYPLMTHSGPKGPAVAALAAETDGPVLFIDDLPSHHASVAAAAPATIRLHMVADPRLRPLIAAAPDAHARHDDWPAALDFIRKAMAP